MRNDSKPRGAVELEAYFLAGLKTAPRFMERFRIELLKRIGEREYVQEAETASALLFPYGDWNRGVLPQLWEIRRDMKLGVGRTGRSVGGRRAVEAIEALRQAEDRPEGAKRTLLVGHSGGGIAAVHAAQLLLARGLSASCFVVLIGSPRCRIPARLSPRVLAIHAEGRKRGGSAGPSPDFVTRFGTYGGWRSGRRIPGWHRDKHAPGTRIAVPIVGRHPDYFREAVPFVDGEGRTNLDRVAGEIVDWLHATAWK